jgi:hypothetical protein
VGPAEPVHLDVVGDAHCGGGIGVLAGEEVVVVVVVLEGFVLAASRVMEEGLTEL